MLIRTGQEGYISLQTSGLQHQALGKVKKFSVKNEIFLKFRETFHFLLCFTIREEINTKPIESVLPVRVRRFSFIVVFTGVAAYAATLHKHYFMVFTISMPWGCRDSFSSIATLSVWCPFTTMAAVAIMPFATPVQL